MDCLLGMHVHARTCLMTRLISINTGAAFDGVYVYASVIVPPWTSGAIPLWVPHHFGCRGGRLRVCKDCSHLPADISGMQYLF